MKNALYLSANCASNLTYNYAPCGKALPSSGGITKSLTTFYYLTDQT